MIITPLLLSGYDMKHHLLFSGDEHSLNWGTVSPKSSMNVKPVLAMHVELLSSTVK
jgi:hypothetical protein